MGQNPTKAADNIYCQCRKEAAIQKPKLYSREGAAEDLGISTSSLSDYELGNTTPPADKVNSMADLYDAPQLRSYYCANECPIGKMNVKQLDVKDMDRSVLELIGSLRKIEKIREKILDITEDGVIDDHEELDLKESLDVLKLLSKQTDEFIMSIEKNNKKI